jgi:hypothetical protein
MSCELIILFIATKETMSARCREMSKEVWRTFRRAVQCSCCAPFRSSHSVAHRAATATSPPPTSNPRYRFHEEALGGPGTRNPITELTIRQKAEPSVNVSQSFSVQYPATPDHVQRNTWSSDLRPGSLPSPGLCRPSRHEAPVSFDGV